MGPFLSICGDKVTNNFNFDNIADDVVSNEPQRQATEHDTENIVASEESDKTIEVNAFDLVPTITEILALTWIRIFGESKEAPLNEEEKDGVNNLLVQGCEMYDLRGKLTGGKGFILALLMKFSGLAIKRLQKQEIRNHIFNKANKEKQDEPIHATEQFTTNQSSDDAFFSSKMGNAYADSAADTNFSETR